ncbi:hypothetical protein AB0D66_28235 [Streptomyces sp. NPDC048270]|uniref:ATP-binding cassette domain-containing protein n=1 Tax=Streptomyces sp. NPDC048270 TaxID=3154615 RepID=UPI00340DF847
MLLSISVALATQNPTPAAYTSAAALLATATAWTQGRRPTLLNPAPPRLDFTLPEPPLGAAGPVQTADPYPIARATTADEAAECILRALRAENIPAAEITDVERKPWGWQLPSVSPRAPRRDHRQSPDLETLFDPGKGDVIVQPLKNRTACATLLLRQGDMFADLPDAPHLAPKSISITDSAVYGGSANGQPLAFPLAGLMGEVIARSGGGKSTLLRALVDVTTACRDAVTLFLDPSGDGPGPYEDAIRLTSLDPATIERTLLWLHCLAAGRARIRRSLGMGDAWQPSAKYPAILVFIDEFPKFTELSKVLVASLLLIGRQEGVWIVFAAQGATTAFLGSNLAQQPALKILGPCRDVDVKAALGGGMMDEAGYPTASTASPATTCASAHRSTSKAPPASRTSNDPQDPPHHPRRGKTPSRRACRGRPGRDRRDQPRRRAGCAATGVRRQQRPDRRAAIVGRTPPPERGSRRPRSDASRHRATPTRRLRRPRRPAHPHRRADPRAPATATARGLTPLSRDGRRASRANLRSSQGADRLPIEPSGLPRRADACTGEARSTDFPPETPSDPGSALKAAPGDTGRV